MEQLEDVAAKAARRYARKVWWAEPQDLKQEAITAALKAQQTWDVKVGVPLNAYAWRACVLHLRAFLWRQSSPVSESKHKLSELRGVHRAELIDVEDDCEPVEALFDEAWWLARVRRQVQFVLDHKLPDPGHQALARRMLLDGDSPRVVSTETGIPIAELYRIAKRVREAIADNNLLYQLWKERS